MSAIENNGSAAVKVYIRQRPLNAAERNQKCFNIVRAIHPREVVLKMGFTENRFICDQVFGPDVTQPQIFSTTVAPMVRNVVGGYNCSLFAYGAAGSGKSHTIFGDIKQAAEVDWRKENSVGLVLRTSQHLFTELSKLSIRTDYAVRLSCIQIYNEEVRDLFGDNVTLRVYDDPLLQGCVCVKELTKVTVFNNRDVLDWITIGQLAHQKAASKYNIPSSRSHIIFSFSVSIREVTACGEEIVKSGRLCLIDLAANEQVGRERSRDSVNRSINSLPIVIKALAQKLPHVPYRLSKLTRLMQDSLGGNTKTAIIATFSPSSNSWDDTIATLDLCQFARIIVTNMQVNMIKQKPNLMKELDDKISKLRDELAALKNRDEVSVGSQLYQKMASDNKEHQHKILKLVGRLAELEQHRSSLDMQYNSLDRSFQKTRDYLIAVRHTLTNRQNALREHDARMTIARDEHRRRTEFANTLSDTSNNSIRTEEIHYKKYAEKSATSQLNAQVSPEMLSTSCNSSQNVTDQAEDNGIRTLRILNEMKQFIALSNSGTQDGAYRMDHTASDMRRHAQEYNVILNELALNGSDGRLRGLQDFLANRSRRNFADVRDQTEISNAIESLGECHEEFIKEHGTEPDYTIHDALNTIQRSEVLMEAGQRNLAELESVLNHGRESLREEQRQNEAAAMFSMQEFARAQQERQAMLNRAATVETAMARLKFTKDCNGNIDLFPDQRWAYNNSQRPRKIVNTSLLRATEALKQAEANEILLRSQAASNTSAFNQQASEIAETVGQNPVPRNEEVFDITHNWRSTLGSQPAKHLSETTNQAFETVTHLSQGQTQKNDNMKRSFSDVVKNLNRFNSSNTNGAEQTGNAEKKTDNCPRKIVGSKHDNNGSPNDVGNGKKE